MNQCDFRHDCGQCRRVPRFGVGQNMYKAGSFDIGNADWEKAITGFYDEVELMDKRQVDTFT